ncbi:MAG: polysaccharide deacetylase family protein [Ruegeria sp.]
MRPNWTPLDHELARWGETGLRLPLWWRDDDAVTPTPELRQLSALSANLSIPVHLAVIPHDADAALASYVKDTNALIPVVHGWAHRNHAPNGEKKSEFRLHRPIEQVASDAKAGFSRLSDLFGDRLRPMFVPPWNRIAPEVCPHLSDIGFRVLSTATPRQSRMAAPGLEQINTHIDPIDWRGTRSLVPADALIRQTTDLLRDRREGRADNSEPFGLLTHHLVHDQDIWNFTKGFLRRLLNGPTDIWTAPPA